MKDKNKPETELVNPLTDMIQGNMPGLPQIIQNAMPPELPRATFEQGSLSLFFGNIKRKQLVKSAEAEAKLARFAHEQTESKLATIHSLVTFSAKVADTLGLYEHNKSMRFVEIQQGYAVLRNLELDTKEKEARIQQIQYQTALIAQEVEAVKLDNRIKLKNARDLLGEQE